MRKFRVWDKVTNKMHIGNTGFHLFSNGALGFNSGHDYEVVDSNNFEVLFYTGLKDKNGKDDYIGDLIRVFVPRDKGVGYELKGIAEIIYNDAYSKTEFIYRTGDFVGNTFDGYELIECYEHQNIGDIFTTPELLNPLNKI